MTDEPEQPAAEGTEPEPPPEPQGVPVNAAGHLQFVGPHSLPVSTSVKLMPDEKGEMHVVLVLESVHGSSWFPLEDQVAEGTAGNLVEALRMKRDSATARLAIAKTMPPDGVLGRLMPGVDPVRGNRAARRRGR